MTGDVKFLRYNANKAALMNLGYGPCSRGATDVNPAILAAQVRTRTRTTTSSRVSLVYVMGESWTQGRGLGLLILPTRGRAACSPAALYVVRAVQQHNGGVRRMADT